MRINENVRFVPLIAPQDIVATATSSPYIRMNRVVGELEFDVMFGTITATDSTGTVVVTVDASSDGGTDASPTAIAFNYRLSAAVGTDNLGDWTAATSSGYTVQHTDDNKVLLVYVDPAVAANKYVRVTLTPGDSPTGTLCAVSARYIPRYAQTESPSSTDAG